MELESAQTWARSPADGPAPAAGGASAVAAAERASRTRTPPPPPRRTRDALHPAKGRFYVTLDKSKSQYLSDTIIIRLVVTVVLDQCRSDTLYLLTNELNYVLRTYTTKPLTWE